MNRRKFVQGLSVMGGSIPFLSGAETVIANPKQKAKSVIYLFMPGGLSQYESFNVDFTPDVLGKSKPIPSNISGKQVSHFVPKMAQQMDKALVLSSVQTNQGAHPAAIYKVLTGYNPRSSITHPELGAWISRFTYDPKDSLPNFISINSRRAGTAGFFPGKYAALPVVDPNSGIRYSQRSPQVSEKDFDTRLSMLQSLNQDFEKQHGSRDTQSYVDAYQASLNFMDSKDIEAFELKTEHKAIASLYEKDKFSQGCMLAARLAEKGVKFIKVELGGWDYHKNIYTDLPKNISMLDNGLSSLLQHLTQKGLLDTTLVVVATEFGRSPNINANAGRDHHPKGFTCLLAGAGVKAGETYGKMNTNGKEIAENPVDVTDLNSTIAWTLGVDPKAEVMSSSGRPFTVDNKKGKILPELFA